VLERLIPNFRELLKQFEGRSCPMCGVLKQREREVIERVRARSGPAFALCGPHIEMTLNGVGAPAARARRVRAAIESIIARKTGCEVCARIRRVELRLVRAIRWLDSTMRFRKAVEAAPLFCRQHANVITDGQLAQDFLQVQRAKVLHLRDALAQAELRNGEKLESLISAALAYLGRPEEQKPCLEIEPPLGDRSDLAQEFERWDEARQLKRLADLESEAASLRYRNAVLLEENRRLTLAHTAGEAIRRDLERDRQQLLEAARETDVNSLKSSNRH
jgi:hypothetical protein